MATLEERVADIEGQVSELTHGLVDVREAVRSLEHRMDVGFEGVDRRFESVDRRLDAIERRFEGVDRRFEALDQKVSRQFLWLVGLQVTTLVTTLVAVIGALLARQ